MDRWLVIGNEPYLSMKNYIQKLNISFNWNIFVTVGNKLYETYKISPQDEMIFNYMGKASEDQFLQGKFNMELRNNLRGLQLRAFVLNVCENRKLDMYMF